MNLSPEFIETLRKDVGIIKEWIDKPTGYQCIIWRDDKTLHLCGYVGVPKNHPCYEHRDFFTPPLSDIEVHGGITFSNYFKSKKYQNFWFIGFDCAHYGDIMPGLIEHFPSHNRSKSMYRDKSYVKQNINLLLKQLKKIKDESN